MNRAMFTSYDQDWNTPKELYKDLDQEFSFDFDPCPNDPNFDGLSIDWGRCNFVNPPYKTKLQDKFARKALIEWRKGKTVVMLVPARTSTKRFHEIFLPFLHRDTLYKG